MQNLSVIGQWNENEMKWKHLTPWSLKRSIFPRPAYHARQTQSVNKIFHFNKVIWLHIVHSWDICNKGFQFSSSLEVLFKLLNLGIFYKLFCIWNKDRIDKSLYMHNYNYDYVNHLIYLLFYKRNGLKLLGGHHFLWNGGVINFRKYLNNIFVTPPILMIKNFMTPYPELQC